MRITYDDQFLITVSDDASLFIHKLSDKEGRGKREKEVSYAEEILITKSDLEEKVLTLHNVSKTSNSCSLFFMPLTAFIRSGFHMILNAMLKSCYPSMFGLLRKDEPAFMTTIVSQLDKCLKFTAFRGVILYSVNFSHLSNYDTIVLVL